MITLTASTFESLLDSDTVHLFHRRHIDLALVASSYCCR